MKILNINIDDTGLASCQLQIVLLNTPHRLYLETVKTVLWTKLTDLDLIYKKDTSRDVSETSTESDSGLVETER